MTSYMNYYRPTVSSSWPDNQVDNDDDENINDDPPPPSSKNHSRLTIIIDKNLKDK